MCSLEFPDLETAIWQRYRDRGLVMYGASPGSNGAGDTDALIRRFATTTGVTFPLVRDPNGYAAFFDVAEGPSRSPYPLDVLIDAEGRLVSVRNAYRPERLQAEIERLLGE